MFEWLLSEAARRKIDVKEAEKQAKDFILGSAKEIEPERERLISSMLAGRKKLDPSLLQWFGQQESVDLGTARTNKEIYNRGGRGLFVISMDGTPATTLIRFNDIASSTYEVRPGHIKGAFQRIYLTNAAEAGKTLKFVVGNRNFAEFMLLDPATNAGLVTLAQTLTDATTPKDLKDLYDELANLPNKSTSALLPQTVELELADTEYFATIPANTKQFKVHERTAAAIRIACITGKVAGSIEPYWSIPANAPLPFEVKDLDMVSSFPLYIASPAASKYAEVVCLT